MSVRTTIALAIFFSLGFAQAASAQVRPTVTVQSAGNSGIGTVVGAKRYVVTPYHVVASGRPVEVRFSDGTTVPAHTLAVDKEHHIAAVVLQRAPSAVQPLQIAKESPDEGDTVTLQQPVHLHHCGELHWTTIQGQVASKGDDAVLVAAPGKARPGVAVLDGDGRLLGIGSGGKYGRGGQDLVSVTPGKAIDGLLREGQDVREPYGGSVRPLFGLAWAGEFRFDDAPEDFNLHGPMMSFGAVFKDRWVARFDAKFLFLDFGDDNPALQRDVNAYQGQLTLGYRMLLTGAGSPMPVYLTPAVGGLVDWVRNERRSLTTDDEGDVIVDEMESGEDKDVHFRPVARIALSLGRLQIAASAQIDVMDPEETRLGVFAGFGY